jgi:hypothetical protein
VIWIVPEARFALAKRPANRILYGAPRLLVPFQELLNAPRRMTTGIGFEIVKVPA